MNEYTIHEAAVALGLSDLAIRKRIRRGHLTAHKRGVQWFIPAADIAAAREAGRLRPGPRARADTPREHRGAGSEPERSGR